MKIDRYSILVDEFRRNKLIIKYHLLQYLTPKQTAKLGMVSEGFNAAVDTNKYIINLIDHNIKEKNIYSFFEYVFG